MAEVRAGDRAKTAKRTGGRSFPMETGAQVASAIRLRHNGHSKGPGEVLSEASGAVGRLLRAGKISAGTADSLRKRIQTARAVDAHRSAK